MTTPPPEDPMRLFVREMFRRVEEEDEGTPPPDPAPQGNHAPDEDARMRDFARHLFNNH